MADEIETTKAKANKPRRSGTVPGALAASSTASREAITLPAAEEAAPLAAAFADEIDVQAVTSPAIVHEPHNGPAATSAPIYEGSSYMATIAPPSPAEAAEKAQAMFGDVQSRVKTAFDRSSKLGEEMVDLAKGNVEALVASSRIAAKGAESIGQEAADYGKKSLESAVAAFKSFASVKSPTELFTLQSEFAKASFDSMVSEASKMSEAMLKLTGEIAQPLSNRYALAAEKIKSAAL